MKTLIAVAFGILALGALAQPASARQITPGQCVTINGVPGHVIRPSTVLGLILVQGDRGGGINGWLPEKIIPAACPGPRVAQNVCSASSPDSDAQTQKEAEFRRIIPENYTHAEARFAALSVRLDSVRMGEPHQWDGNPNEFSHIDAGQPIYPVHVAFATCKEYGDEIVIHTQETNFNCFTQTSGQGVCEPDPGTDHRAPPTNQRLPKY